MKHSFHLILSAAILFSAVGCANGTAKNRFQSDLYKFDSSAVIGGNFSNVFDCEDPNVFPVGAQTPGAANEFKACPNLTNPAQISLRGYTTYSSTNDVCVFPVQAYSSGTLQFFPAVSGSGQAYLFQCGRVDDETPSILNFNVTYNSVVVVGANDAGPFQMYLYSGGLYTAPPRSAGRFR